MTKRELIDYCLTYPDAIETYPFDEVAAVIKHVGNKKMFALVSERDGELSINLKCDPFKADFYRTIYKSVIPGYHMNKEHWNTVQLHGDVPIEQLHDMIGHSYELTSAKNKKKL